MTTRRKWRPSSFQYLQVEKDFWRIKKVHKNFHSSNKLTVKSIFITEAKHSKTSPGCMLGGWWPSTFELKSCLWPRSDFDTSHRLVWSYNDVVLFREENLFWLNCAFKLWPLGGGGLQSGLQTVWRLMPESHCSNNRRLLGDCIPYFID